MYSYKTGIAAYNQSAVVGITGRDLSVKIVKSIISYINESLTLLKEDESSIRPYQLLDNANTLVINLLENMNAEIPPTEREILVKILVTVADDIIKTIRGNSVDLEESKKGLDAILDVLES